MAAPPVSVPPNPVYPPPPATGPVYPPPGPAYPPPAQPHTYQPPAPTYPQQPAEPPPAPPATPWAHQPQPPPPATPWAHQPQPGYAVPPPPAQTGFVPVDRAKSWATQSMWWSLAGLCTLFTLIVAWVFAIKALNESRRTGLSINRVYLALGLAALLTGVVVVVVIYALATGDFSSSSS
jgi:hypothetical protein